ncbi:MAG: hypothetical protein Q9221_000730 [Calogaya cf. arnoldii]
MSRPSQTDYIFYALLIVYTITLSAFTIVPIWIRRSFNPNLHTRFQWLAILIYAYMVLPLIPIAIWLPATIGPGGRLKKQLVVRFVYRRHPTWFPYLMEVDPKFGKDTISDEDAVDGELAIYNDAEKGDALDGELAIYKDVEKAYATFDMYMLSHKELEIR